MSNEITRPEFINFPVQETGLSLLELKQIVQRRWQPALAVAVTIFVGGFLATVLQTPQYQSETLILMDSSPNKEATSVSPIPKSIQQYSSFNVLKDLSTEILILQSRSLILKAIKEHPKAFVDLTLQDIRENLSIQQAAIDEIPTDVIVVAFRHRDPKQARAVLEALNDTYVDYSLNRQRSQATNAIEFIDEQLPKAQQELDAAALSIRHFRQVNNLVDPNDYALQVANYRQSLEERTKELTIAIRRNRDQIRQTKHQLIELGQDPEIMVANTVLGQDQVYQNLAAQLKELEMQHALGSVNFHDAYRPLADLQLKKEQLQKLLRERGEQILGNTVNKVKLDEISITQTPNFVASGVTGTSTTNAATTSSSANNQNSTANSATSSSNANGTNDSSSADNSSSNSTASNNSSQKNSTNSSQASRATITGVDNVNSSQVSTGGNILQTLSNTLVQVQNESVLLHSQLAGIQQAKVRVETDFQRLPQLQETFANLHRQLEVKNQALNYLLQRKQELQIAEAEEIAPWQVLDTPSLPPKPISPNLLLGLILSLFSGGLLGGMAAILLQQLDQRVKRVDEVKQITQLSLLGNIPKVDHPAIQAPNAAQEQLHSYNYYYSSFTEGLRALAMNVRNLVIDRGRVKSLAVTSSTSSEGKTTVSYNLGVVLAELGLQVLVVDADMRKPKMHKLAGLTNEEGLSNAIVSDRLWTDFVQTNETENLHIMTSGKNSPNPIALLNSNKMKQLLREWQEVYDYVILDTPPIGVMADAKSIANQIDTMLFIAGIDRATNKAISNSLEILRSSQCNIAGFVANMVDRDFDYYAYSYYDSYYNQPVNQGDDNGNEELPEGRMQQLLQQFRRR